MEMTIANWELVLKRLKKVENSILVLEKFLGSRRWEIDTDLNQMIFFDKDNNTEIARYDLIDFNLKA